VPIFQQLAAGDVREQILVAFRNSLRELVDPATGAAWTEDVIRQATMAGSRFWVEAEAIDLVGLGMQRRAAFLASQVDPRRSTTAFLEDFHGRHLPRLLATGGNGEVDAEATPGTVYIASTTVPDPLATKAADKAGLQYQVFSSSSVTVGDSGKVTLRLQAIDTGRATNLANLAELTWVNPPPGSAPKCVVSQEFTGGTPRESDQEWGERLFEARSTRPRAGNPAHFRLWAKRASNAVADAFVYPCALNAGSVVVAVVQKRARSERFDARIPSAGTMSVVSGYLTPPSSPVVPGRVHVVVVPAVAEAVDAVVSLGMRRASPAGWADASPWPGYAASAATILSVTDELTFRMSSDTERPTFGTPQLMVWHALTSEFERLNVASVTLNAGAYDVVLATAPEVALLAGKWISPYSPRLVALSAGVVAYFDALGPGELVSLASDVRAGRAYRRPRPEVTAPYTVGSALLTYLSDALGGAVSSSRVESLSRTDPTIPATASEGPRLLVPGKFAVYPAAG